MDALRDALKKAQAVKGKPCLIIGKTIMGKGAVTADGSSFENKCATHGAPLGESGACFEKTIEHLGGDPADPFSIFPEVAELYTARAKELGIIVAKKYSAKAEWAKANPEAAAKLAT